MTLQYLANTDASAGVSQNYYQALFYLTSGYSLLQYDGIDNSLSVNITGFKAIPEASTGVNFLLNNGAAFNLTYETEINTLGVIYVFDIYGGLSSVEVTFDEVVNGKRSMLIPFSVFQGFADFENVGAVELYLSGDNMDFMLFYFGTWSK